MQVSKLKGLLPTGTSEENGHMEMDEDDTHEITSGMSLVDNIEEELRGRAKLSKGHGGEAYNSDDDDDMPRGAQRVQCAQS